MRRLLILAFISIIAFTTNAQKSASGTKRIKISVAGDIGITLGDYSAFSVLTYGGDVQGEYIVSSKFGITLSGGFVSLSNRLAFHLFFRHWPVHDIIFCIKFMPVCRRALHLLFSHAIPNLHYQPAREMNSLLHLVSATSFQKIWTCFLNMNPRIKMVLIFLSVV